MTTPKRKLIEVALPLEAINRASAREKSIRHGHPSTLHLWWARRPLAACRAVLFAQLVDDPSSRPEDFPTEDEQTAERKRLFELIERLVMWENSNDEGLLDDAHKEILKSTGGKPPKILDPFAGGGSIPLEAQRLGLEVEASDLNPVAVLINKALIEIPPKWAGRRPVYPGAAESRLGAWPKATGLAEDVRRYGLWMRDKAETRIGHLYPKAMLSDGSKAKVIAWIWARTVVCPNPACGIKTPLMRSFWLSKRRDRPAWVTPIVEHQQVRFDIRAGSEGPSSDGTVGRSGAVCVACGGPIDLSHVREQGRTGGLGVQLVAIVAEGIRRRIYLPATAGQVSATDVSVPSDVPETDLPIMGLGFRVQAYGMTRHRDLFTNRQLMVMKTFNDLAAEVRNQIASDLLAAKVDPERAASYADDVTLYLALCASKMAMFHCTLGRWRPDADKTAPAFGRQVIAMVWDFAEGNPFGGAGGDWTGVVEGAARTLEKVPADGSGKAVQTDAQHISLPTGLVVSTDPPYYDNVGYADLSDFFYVWLRRSLVDRYPALLATLLTPKAAELVADSSRHRGARAAQHFFEDGSSRVFSRVRDTTQSAFPMVVFYAFKQSETGDHGTVSTGWEVLLEGVIRSGWEVTGTWPIRTESASRLRSRESNVLASSIVLACRARREDAGLGSRRTFVTTLKQELPRGLRDLQQGSIAPVDLAQAAIGPGMSVFSRFSKVVEVDGSEMTVRTALALINRALDEVLAEQEGDFDSDTRFCLKWFSQFGWNEGSSGEADVLARATNTSVAGLIRGGVFRAIAGKAQLLSPEDLPEQWDPLTDERVSDWEVVVRLAKALDERGAEAASDLMRLAGQVRDLDTAKELAYLLFSLAEKKGWIQAAILFNGLGTSWNDLEAAARAGAGRVQGDQGAFSYDTDDEI